MTKYEWESELKKNIYRLPKSEQDKVLEYYNELFQDKIELGRTESQAIMEFGNPMDVAYKILAEYASENPGFSPSMQQVETPIVAPVYTAPTQSVSQEQRIETPAMETPKQEKAKKGYKSVGKTVCFVILMVLFGGAVLGLMVGLWGLIVGLFGVVIGTIGGGVGTIVGSFFVMNEGLAVFLSSFGAGVACLGLGLIVSAAIKPAIKGVLSLCKILYNLFFGWYFKKKEENLL